jgi:hypothetical protein
VKKKKTEPKGGKISPGIEIFRRKWKNSIRNGKISLCRNNSIMRGIFSLEME